MHSELDLTAPSGRAAPLFGPEQSTLPWSDPDLWLVPLPPGFGPDPAHGAVAGGPPGSDQLSLGANQIPVWEIEPEPCQPSLLADLPDPPWWEATLARPASLVPGALPPPPLPGQLRIFR